MNHSIKYLFVSLLILFSLIACSSKQQDPKAGEYGQVKIAYSKLEQNHINQINQSTMPKPDPKNRPGMSIGFELDPTQNPYRFVAVIKGTAINDGEVNMKLFGGIEREGQGYKPEAYISPTTKYKANEPVTLVISSDPFSGNAKEGKKSYYYVNTELTGRENIKVSSIELQIWQGKGSTYSFTSYLKFLVIFLILFTISYRAYTVLTQAR